MTESRTTGFDLLPSGGGTAPQFAQSRGTGQGQHAPDIRFESEPAGLVEWLGTPEARQYEGQWVLLRDDFEIIDHAHSPTELLKRNPNPKTPLVVFVDRPDVNRAV